MFLISLAIFTLILTVFENIFLAFGVLIIILIAYFIVKQKITIQTESSKTLSGLHLSRNFFFIIGAFVLSLTSVLIKNYNYSQKIDNFIIEQNYQNGQKLISQNLDGPQGNYFVGTGQVSDIYSYQKFVFTDNGGRDYFLKSEKKYNIGDNIWLNGYVSPAYTGSKNIFNLQSQRQNLLQKPNLSGFFDYEFDYPKRLMMKGFYGTIFEQNSVVIIPDLATPHLSYSGRRGNGDAKAPFLQGEGLGGGEREVKYNLSFLQKIRKSLQQKIIQAYGENPQAGLILGMLVGDRSQIPPDEYDGFIDSGLVHIIAVSGGNIIMIVVFLGFVLFFLPFYVRNAVILASIIVYAMICGLDSSVFRATIMGGLGMLALFWGREVNIRRAMSIAFIVMLVVNPYFLAYDVGFLLSFSAIIGIVYFGKWVDTLSNLSTPHLSSPGRRGNGDVKAPLLQGEGLGGGVREVKSEVGKEVKLGGSAKKLREALRKFLKEYITPTIGATLGVLPVMLFFMGKTNLTGIVANFLVVPIIAIVMIYGFISTMLFQIFPRQIVLWPEKFLITYIYSISDLATKRGIYLQADGSWIKYALLGLFVVWFVSERMKK